MSNMEIDSLKVYTVEEVATVLHVSAREVNRLVRNKELDIFHLGKKRRLRRVAGFSLMEFVKKRIAETQKSENS